MSDILTISIILDEILISNSIYQLNYNSEKQCSFYHEQFVPDIDLTYLIGQIPVQGWVTTSASISIVEMKKGEYIEPQNQYNRTVLGMDNHKACVQYEKIFFDLAFFYIPNHQRIEAFQNIEFSSSHEVTNINSQNQSNGKTIIEAIYPNPFSNELKISLLSNIKKSSKIEIFNLSGMLLYKTEISGYQELMLDTDIWEKGIYLIKITTGDNLELRKIVKS